MPYGPAAFQRDTDVSRETLARFERYANLLRKWQRAVNLVGAATMSDIWRRHFLDSAQLLALAPANLGPWLDIGSGAGFPGMVLAIMGATDVHLIESNGRKCAFLKEVARDTMTPVRILHGRADDLPPVGAAVITARAVAPLPRLINLAKRHARADTVYLYLKGQDVDRELTEATKCRTMRVEKLPSISDPSGVIVRITHHDK